jgi:ArsR family transcriptional regulator
MRNAEVISAMGTEPRQRTMRLLLSAHPDGLVVGDVATELQIASSTLSHHLERLKSKGLVKVRREGAIIWCSASTDAMQELRGILYAECCNRNKADEPEEITCCS